MKKNFIYQMIMSFILVFHNQAMDETKPTQEKTEDEEKILPIKISASIPKEFLNKEDYKIKNGQNDANYQNIEFVAKEKYLGIYGPETKNDLLNSKSNTGTHIYIKKPKSNELINNQWKPSEGGETFNFAIRYDYTPELNKKAHEEKETICKDINNKISFTPKDLKKISSINFTFKGTPKNKDKVTCILKPTYRDDEQNQEKTEYLTSYTSTKKVRASVVIPTEYKKSFEVQYWAFNNINFVAVNSETKQKIRIGKVDLTKFERETEANYTDRFGDNTKPQPNWDLPDWDNISFQMEYDVISLQSGNIQNKTAICLGKVPKTKKDLQAIRSTLTIIPNKKDEGALGELRCAVTLSPP